MPNTNTAHSDDVTLALNACPACHSKQLRSCTEVAAQMHPHDEVFNFDQCTNCQLVMLNPRVPPADLPAYYTEYYMPYRGAAAWGVYRPVVALDQRRQDVRRTRLLNDISPLTQRSTILDIGCGKPTFLRTSQQKYGVRGIGLDFSDRGWAQDVAQYPGLDLRVGEAHDLHLSAAPDFITMWHYLEHDYNPSRTLRDLAQLSKPGTHLMIEVPNFNSESRKRYGKHWAGWHTPRHTFLFSPDNLKLLLTKTGWEVQRVHLSGTLSDYLLYWMSEMEIKKVDWRKNMADEFWGFARGLLRFRWRQLFRKNTSNAIMLVVARRARS